jgi:16S rRNA (guanine527-N7)-methyltransferase
LHPLSGDFPSFASACRDLGLELTQPQYDCLVQYERLLRDWNSRINLISRRDTARILSYHVTDSLAASRLIPAGARCCDIGTGAGLPGVPLAIARPDIKIVLVESSQKKCIFLKAAVRELGLTNVDLVNARAESLPSLGCDIVLCRLTGPLKDVLKHAAHHRKLDGLIVLYKTKESEPELAKSAKLLARSALRVTARLDLTLPLSCTPRRFVMLGSVSPIADR